MANKQSMIWLLTDVFTTERLSVSQVRADADTLVVEKVLQAAQSHKNVVVTAEDTDILVMLLRHSEWQEIFKIMTEVC